MQTPEKTSTRTNTKYKIDLTTTKVASWTLLGVGVAALIISIIYASSILSFIGLGLLFWGAILLYIRDQEYTRKVLLDASVLPSLTTINQLVQKLNYKGNAVYLPPKYFEDPETTKIYIPKQENTSLPKPEQTKKYEKRLLVGNPKDILGILLTPPGAELTRLFEKTLKTSFTRVDLEHLQRDLPKLFVEDLEIAEDLEIQIIGDSASSIKTKKGTIHVKITNSIYKDIHKETRELPHICDQIGCPICSAIACAIAKSSDKLVTIEKTECTEDGKIIEAYYRIIEE